jgi:DHA1 family bicyclomycin/chloramphenicol resistance-like MFS transporter
MTRETTMKQLTVGTLGALVAAYALGPMATQILTPAVPFVHRDFGISMAAAQTLISLAFATIAVMTLVYGPLSDRYGRRPVILGGTALFCLGSLIAALAPTPEAMIAGRVLQAAGSSAGLVLTRNVVHDVYGRERSAKILAYVTIVMVFVPTLSPLAGGMLLDHTSWRAIFALCGAIGAVALLLLAARLPETHTARPGRFGLREAFGGFGALLADRRYLGPALFFSFVMATFFVTQAAIPYLIVEVRGGTATEYGAWFVVLGAFYIGGNYASARWGDLVPRRMLIVFSGVGCLATAIAGLVAVSAWGWDTATLFVPAIALSLFGAIAIAPVQAEAVAAQPGRSGAASGLMSGMQMALGAAAVQFIGFTHDGTPYPMFIALIACTAGALIAYCGATLAARRARPRSQARAAATRRPVYVGGVDSLR